MGNKIPDWSTNYKNEWIWIQHSHTVTVIWFLFITTKREKMQSGNIKYFVVKRIITELARTSCLFGKALLHTTFNK